MSSDSLSFSISSSYCTVVNESKMAIHFYIHGIFLINSPQILNKTELLAKFIYEFYCLFLLTCQITKINALFS